MLFAVHTISGGNSLPKKNTAAISFQSQVCMYMVPGVPENYQFQSNTKGNIEVRS